MTDVLPSQTLQPAHQKKWSWLSPWIYEVLLVYILLIGAFFRFVGIEWGDFQYLHPDERFLIWVGTDIQPIGTPDSILGTPPNTVNNPWRANYASAYPDCQSWGGYFAASCSPLNPNNRGHSFYVYGTLPMFLTRYAVQIIYGHSGFNEMTVVGRVFSAVVDLLSIIVVYAIGSQAFKKSVGLLAAAFYAFTVLNIQQSHFFTMDTFFNFFTVLAVYFAVRVGQVKDDTKAIRLAGTGDASSSLPEGEEIEQPQRLGQRITNLIKHPYFGLSIAFGIALGCAVASKLSAAPVAFVLPLAFGLVVWRKPQRERSRWLVNAFVYLGIAAFVSILVFRILQPYAFLGPGFFGLRPNPQWLANIKEQRAQAAGDIDFPPSLQWANRPLWFSAQNLIEYGLGLPLGILAFIGFLWAGWRMLKGEWQQHLVLWLWGGFYFAWQSLMFNPTMRYQLPTYPILAIYAGWALVELWNYRKRRLLNTETGEIKAQSGKFRWARPAALIGGGVVMVATLAWALAFSLIYTRPVTRVAASDWIFQNIPGPINLHIQAADGMVNQPLSMPYSGIIEPGLPYQNTFVADADGVINDIYLGHVVNTQESNTAASPGTQTLVLSLVSIESLGNDLLGSTAAIEADFTPGASGLGAGYTMIFNQPFTIQKGMHYLLTLSMTNGSGTLSVQGSAVANEGDWDDGLPLRVNGNDPFGGIYTPGLNFNMYTDDNLEKLNHFIDIYNQSEYLLISSNRQWGSLPRLPERFPMTTLHYRHLLGCPDDKTIAWCYSVAQPGMFQGDLGFDLVAVFQSDPTLGPFSINDQFAEEAFTVYDHPKVLVFKKNSAYSSANARQILSQADFSEMVRITPKKATSHPANLLLPEVSRFIQSIGGTWSQLFNSDGLLNSVEPLGVIVWYLSVAVLGLLTYPLLRLTLPGLADKGYPLARTAGMLILAYLTWLAGSASIPFTRLTITVVLLLMAIAGVYLAYRQRDELRQEWHDRKRYFLVVEGLVLGFFLLFLFIRLGNPDLWHPYKGGEKPMDFSYLNAVLKSTTFPPYDPWYAGGYMNYYYWGFVFVGVLVKWLGLVPSFAYNLIIPTLFSMVTMGAFSIGYNLSHLGEKKGALGNGQDPPGDDQPGPTAPYRAYLIGLAAALGMGVLGNLGTLRMIVKGWESLAIPGGLTDATPFLTRLAALPVGLWDNLFHGVSLSYSVGDWYWIPSRAIPAPGDVEPITEFPMFTFLYADLHAHMMAMAIAMLAITWAVAVLMGKARWQSIGVGVLSIVVGGLAIGALYPTNLSDIYTYLPIGMLVLGYAVFRYADVGWFTWPPRIAPVARRLSLAVIGMLLLVVLSYGLYLPYRMWYAQPYSSVIPWTGTHTPFVSYLTHWGLFLFVIISWMVWETHEWMASTPLSSLRKLHHYTSLILSALVVIFLACLLLSIKIPGIESMGMLSKMPIGRGASLAWFILPLAAWAGVLLLRPGMPDLKRLVLFLVGTGLLITLMVEVVVVRGDIGRMNTVFKFYLQAWALFAVSAAAALGWLLGPVKRWLPGWRISWRAAFSFLVFSAALFTLYGSMAKIKDRWVTTAPHTLDGMAYMPYATYYQDYPNVTDDTPADQRGVNMDLSQDYRAIRWMQENVQGSPVIVEANSPNYYRWYSRFTVYTGLPGVLGWQWHEQQQRALNPPGWVSKRLSDINQFYTTVDTDVTKQFLNLYQVKYIVVGQLEAVTYPGAGLEKFPAFNGVLWNVVYQDANTTIYEVIP
jgi:YYY domain-containing protein